MNPVNSRSIALIVNRNSGTSRPPGELAELLASRGVSAQIFEKDDPGEAASQASEAGFETLIAAGGDGTIRAVSCIAAQNDRTLGILPVGTLNHFAGALGISSDLDQAVDVIAAGRTKQVDIAEVNGHYFVNNSSLGLYPAMVVQRKTEEKHGFSRWMATIRAGVMTWLRLPTLDVRLTAKEARIVRTTPLVFVGNNEYQMTGVNAGSRNSLTDGLLFVSVAEATSRFDVIRIAFGALLGHLKEMDEFDAFSTTEAVVDSRRPLVRVSLDGEVLLMRSPLHYRIHPAGLRVLAP